MSGHNKWQQIRHKKGIADKKKGQLFSKLSKLISLTARKGVNPETNIELKNAIEQARSFDMPRDNIERAIKRVSDKSATQLEELSIEAIGPGGIALKIKAITDNRNRTIAVCKHILNGNNSKLVPPGSISWMFGQQVTISSPETQDQVDKLFEALDNNDDVEDVISNLK